MTPPATSSRASAPTRAVAARLPDRRWDFLLVVVAAYIANAVGRVQELFPILMPLKLSLVTQVVGIIGFLVHQRGSRRLSALRGRTTTAVLLLLLWAVMSVPEALNRGVAFFFFTQVLIKTLIMYFLIVGAVRGTKDVERLALVYYAGAALYSAIVVLRFNVGSGDDWRLGNLYYYDANDFATFAVTAIPLGLYFSVSGSTLRRAVSAMGLLAIGVAFVRSGSRGGFLAILAVGLYVLFGYTTVRAKWRVLGTVLVAGTLLLTAGDKYWTQMRTIVEPDQDYNRSAETGRIPIWKRGIGYMVHHPILGVGLYNFPVAEGTISPQADRQEFNVGVAWSAAHNSYVQVGAELGIPGLYFLLTIVLGSIAAMRRMAKIGPPAVHTGIDPARLAQALAGALIGFAVGGFFLSLAYHEMLYALAGLAAALSKVMPARATAASPRPLLAQSAPLAGLTGVTMGSAQRAI